jgi:hypothetical protein
MLPGEWQIGMSPNITMNWEADPDNRFTVPVGLGVGKLIKLGKLPVKIQLQGQYSVIHPDDHGQRWNFQLQVTPVIPNLISGTLFNQNRNPGPQGQVRDNRLCHKSKLLMVSGVRFQVSVNTEF